MYFAEGQLAVIQGANEVPLSESYGPREQRSRRRIFIATKPMLFRRQAICFV